MSGEELFREVLSGVNCDDRKSPKRNSAEGNCPKRNGLGVNYYEELSGEELSYNLLGIRSFDIKIDFMRNNKSLFDMTLLKMDFFRQN